MKKTFYSMVVHKYYNNKHFEKWSQPTEKKKSFYLPIYFHLFSWEKSKL